MNKRLKNAIQWTIYVLIVLLSLFTIGVAIAIVILPVCCPAVNIESFRSYINTIGIILSCLSVGLGVYSVYQAVTSEKQAHKIIKSLQGIKKKQDILGEQLSQKYMYSTDYRTNVNWVQDENKD